MTITSYATLRKTKVSGRTNLMTEKQPSTYIESFVAVANRLRSKHEADRARGVWPQGKKAGMRIETILQKIGKYRNCYGSNNFQIFSALPHGLVKLDMASLSDLELLLLLVAYLPWNKIDSDEGYEI